MTEELTIELFNFYINKLKVTEDPTDIIMQRMKAFLHFRDKNWTSTSFPSSSEQCNICYDTMSSGKFCYKPCNHSFCLSCVKDNIKTLVENGEYLMRCRYSNCSTVIPMNYVLENLIDDERLKKQFISNCFFNFNKDNSDFIHRSLSESFITYIRDFAQICPKCKTVVEKNGGCQHMTCKCGEQFCFECGEEWNGGRGHSSPCPKADKKKITK